MGSGTRMIVFCSHIFLHIRRAILMANLVRIGGNAKARSLSILMLAICFAATGDASAQTSQKPAPQEPAQKSVSPKTVAPKHNEPPGVLVQLNGGLESLAA